MHVTPLISVGTIVVPAIFSSARRTRPAAPCRRRVQRTLSASACPSGTRARRDLVLPSTDGDSAAAGDRSCWARVALDLVVDRRRRFMLARSACERSASIGTRRAAFNLSRSGVASPCSLPRRPDRPHLVGVAAPSPPQVATAWRRALGRAGQLLKAFVFFDRSRTSTRSSRRATSSPARASLDSRFVGACVARDLRRTGRQPSRSSGSRRVGDCSARR